MRFRQDADRIQTLRTPLFSRKVGARITPDSRRHPPRIFRGAGTEGLAQGRRRRGDVPHRLRPHPCKLENEEILQLKGDSPALPRRFVQKNVKIHRFLHSARPNRTKNLHLLTNHANNLEAQAQRRARASVSAAKPRTQSAVFRRVGAFFVFVVPNTPSAGKETPQGTDVRPRNAPSAHSAPAELPCRKVDHTNPIKTFVRLGAHRHRRRAKGGRVP